MTDGLFVLGDFVAHSGKTLHWKIECDALNDGDVAALAKMLAERLPPFAAVVGVPRGGLRLAQAMEPYRDRQIVAPRLIVDDVLTTGGSMLDAKQQWEMFDGWIGPAPEGETLGAVLFARGPCPSWVTPLFTLAPEVER